MATSSSSSGDSEPAQQRSNVIEVNDNKAGMSGIDKARIGKIIEEASRGSKFYQRQEAKKASDAKRAAETRRKIDALSSDALAAGEKAGDAEIRRAMSGSDFSRTHVHLDMDAFYAAVEMLDNPRLRHVPMAVGGNDMLSTSNYAARRFGVRAAMPGFIAKKLCPQLVIVPCRFRRYKEVSRQVQEVLADYDPQFSAASLDEAYLDITDHLTTRLERNILPGPQITCQCSGQATLSSANAAVISEATLNTNSNSNSNAFLDIVHSDEDVNPDATADVSNDAGVLQEAVAKADGNDMIIKSEALASGVDLSNNATAGTDSRIRVCPDCHRAALAGRREFGAGAVEAVAELRYRVFLATGLTASAGIGPNPMIAKIGSDFNKPNGQYRVDSSPDRVLEFIRPLPVRKVPGIGRVAESWLSSLGVGTCRELYERRGALYHVCRPLTFQFYMRACVGVGGGFGYGRSDQPSDQSAANDTESDRKSVSVERTFQTTDNVAWLIDEKLPELCDTLVRHLNKASMVGRTVTLKLKLDSFEVLTRSHGLPSATDSVEAIRAAAAALIRQEFPPGRPPPRVRLLGVRLSSLTCSSSAGVGTSKQARLDDLLIKSTRSTNDVDFEDDSQTSSTSILASASTSKASTSKVESNSTSKVASNLMSKVTSAQTSTSASLASASNVSSNDNDDTLHCPVCSLPQSGGLVSLNRHLDFCLSRSAIQTAVNDFSNESLPPGSALVSTSAPPTVSSRKRVETSAATNVTSSGSGVSNQAKRSKINGRGATIDRFFVKSKPE